MARVATSPFVVALVAAAIVVRAQSVNQKPPTFEVASVKVNNSGDRRASMQMNLTDAFVATNQTLRSLVSILYQVPVFKMVGAPNWFSTERFDIAAKAEHRITMDEKRAMLRSLLEDRFHLKTHHETHEGRIYALAIARSDGKLGPNLKPSAYDCANILAARQRGETPTLPPPTPGDPAHGRCLAMFRGPCDEALARPRQPDRVEQRDLCSQFREPQRPRTGASLELCDTRQHYPEQRNTVNGSPPVTQNAGIASTRWHSRRGASEIRAHVTWRQRWGIN